MKRILMTIPLLVAAACASAPQQKTTPAPPSFAPSYGRDMGTSPVGVIPAATLHDTVRNKTLEMSIEYPTRGSGPFPIIIFSPGYGGSSHGYEGLVSYWTSYGYVVIRPSHADAGAMTDTMRDLLAMRKDQRPQDQDRRGDRRRNGDRNGRPDAGPANAEQARMRPNPAEAIWDKEREPQWQNRVADITLILNGLNDLEKNYPELAGKMDHARIGVGGHSYGAFTAMQAAGVKTSGSTAAGDPRIKAIIAMSPQGVAANRGLTAESFRDLRVPAMFMTGTRDYASENEGPEWRRTAFENSPAGDKYFVIFRGAGHMTFTGTASGLGEQMAIPREAPIVDPRTGEVLNPGSMQPQRAPEIADRGTFGNIRSTSLIFWDAYLKDKQDARALLDPSKYAGAVELTRK